MQQQYVDISSISDLHELYGLPKPRHPLVTIFDLNSANREKVRGDCIYRLGFYSVYYKKIKGSIRYGKSYYDFNEGSMMFTAPGQVVAPDPEQEVAEGWGLMFHPDLLNKTALGKKIAGYSFFHYEVNEALHISEEEEKIIRACADNIRREYSQLIDKHTQGLIESHIELLLSYCDRFYDRQFFTRARAGNDIVQRFESTLKAYFEGDHAEGLPGVAYFAAALNVSPNYLSDLLKRYTGKSTQEHIHLELVERAKMLLWGSGKSVSEIAYELGFGYPSHFTKIFKSKTGLSPLAFREGGRQN